VPWRFRWAMCWYKYCWYKLYLFIYLFLCIDLFIYPGKNVLYIMFYTIVYVYVYWHHNIIIYKICSYIIIENYINLTIFYNLHIKKFWIFRLSVSFYNCSENLFRISQIFLYESLTYIFQNTCCIWKIR